MVGQWDGEWIGKGVRGHFTTELPDFKGLACWVVTLHRCVLTHLKNWTSLNLIKIDLERGEQL